MSILGSKIAKESMVDGGLISSSNKPYENLLQTHQLTAIDSQAILFRNFALPPAPPNYPLAVEHDKWRWLG
jgi:hypothetical protein